MIDLLGEAWRELGGFARRMHEGAKDRHVVHRMLGSECGRVAGTENIR